MRPHVTKRRPDRELSRDRLNTFQTVAVASRIAPGELGDELADLADDLGARAG